MSDLAPNGPRSRIDETASGFRGVVLVRSHEKQPYDSPCLVSLFPNGASVK